MSKHKLPQLPPLEEVLAGVRNVEKKKEIEIDYKAEYESLKKQVDKLTKILEKEVEVSKTPKKSLPEERTYDCPILRRQIGEGEIKVFPGKISNKVVCPNSYNGSCYSGDLILGPCQYTELK